MLPHTGPVPAGLVRHLACDADIIPAVLDTQGRVLDVGRAKRLFPAWMRQAMIARDGGCTFPGCTTPATWCQGHHLIEWWKGGETSLPNSTLLCPSHHASVHSGQWFCHRDREGRLVFTPPWATTPGRTRNPYPRGE